MSLIAQVTATTGASRDDVLRVATHGGTSAADWDIARAIETITGRPAADIMWAAQDRLPEPHAIAPTNPHAQHDPEVRIYPEHTSPEESREVIAHPGHDEDDVDDQDSVDEDVEEFAARVYSDLDDLLRPTLRSTARVIRAWTTTAQARQDLQALVSAHAHRRLAA